MKAAIVPKFIKAKNEEELSRKMFEVQVRLQRKVHWFNIYEKKNGTLIAWYEDNYGR